MELLRGQSLGKWARTGIDLPRALAVLVQICDGLGAAHAVGVVHRDLKPDNVIVVPTSDGAELVKLLDFGVAKLLNRDDEDVGFQTAAGSVIGTPAYMSPEQAGGMAVDHRSRHLLARRDHVRAVLRPADVPRPLVRRVRAQAPHREPGAAAPDAGRRERSIPHLEALILKCLAKDPNERFSHILELRDGLLHMLGGIETHPPTATPSLSDPRQSPIRPPQPQCTTHAAAAHAAAAGADHDGPTDRRRRSHTSRTSAMSQVGSVPSIYNPYRTAQPPEPATPWWVWFVGGAIAVGLGIAGALWYAGSTEHADCTTACEARRAGRATDREPDRSARAAQDHRAPFDSLPSGGVYADGRSAELCRTPCNFNVDLGDGEADRSPHVRRARRWLRGSARSSSTSPPPARLLGVAR